MHIMIYSNGIIQNFPSYPYSSKFNIYNLYKMEDYLLNKYRACERSEYSALQYLSNVDLKKLKQDVTNNFYNPNVLQAVECLIYGIISQKSNIRNYFTNLE